MRFFLPPIADLIFVALFALLLFTNLSTTLLGDAGIGWHIRTGELILANRTIPHTDPFSSSSPFLSSRFSSTVGQPWFAWEWLYDVLVGTLDSLAGLNAVVAFTAVIIAATFAFAFRLLQRRGTNLLIAVCLMLLAASASMIHFLARPHVVSWFFAVLWFWILDCSERNPADHDSDVAASRRFNSRLWLLPPLMLIWVNLHGGFLLGFVFLSIYWLSAVWEWWRLDLNRIEDALAKVRARQRLRTLTLTGLLSALATIVNPYGIQLHAHIYRYLSNRFLMDHIDEFQSPNFHYVAQKCFAILLLLSLLALAFKRSSIRASHLLLGLFAVYSGLYASRNIPVSSFLLILVIGPMLSSELGGIAKRFQFFERMDFLDSKLQGHLWPIVAVLLAGLVAVHPGRSGGMQWLNTHFDEKRFPVAAIDDLAKRDAQLSQGGVPNQPVSIFCPDSWGGYVIYRLYPNAKVVVDDRHDFYGEDFLRSYLKTMHATPGWDDFLAQHPARYVLVPKESPLASVLLLTQHSCAKSSGELLLRFQPGRANDDEATVFTGSAYRLEVERRRFSQTPANGLPLRKPPQSVTAAEWRSQATWAGPR